MDKIINILFTSVGRRVELLKSFKDAYDKLNLKGNIIGTDIDPLAPALQLIDKTYLVPPVNSTHYLSALLEICRKEKVHLIFPLIDPDILVLASGRQQLESAGARVVVVSKEKAQIAADKYLTYNFFKTINVPTPRSWLPDELKNAKIQFPVYVKPRFGSAGKNAFKAKNKEELIFFLKYIPDPIIQEFLPGPEITNDVISDFDGRILAVVSRQRIEVRWGEVAKGVTIYNPFIIDSCVKIAKKLDAIGPITIQCIMKNNIPHFTEINARFGGGVPLGIAAGVNSPLWLLAKAAGVDIKIPLLGSYKVGLRMTRFDDSFFLDQEDFIQKKNLF